MIFIFRHSISLAIHFAISKDGLALYKKISKKLSFLEPCKVRGRKSVHGALDYQEALEAHQRAFPKVATASSAANILYVV